MGEERRLSKRTNIDVTISLQHLDNGNPTGDSGDAVSVNVVDISKTGMAFRSSHKFLLNTYYNTRITLDNKETIQTVIEIIRAESREDSIYYGCRFIGITAEEQFKIDVYQIVTENNPA